MDTKELNFLLKLLSKPNDRSPISEINPTEKTSAAERDRICRQLGDRQLVGYSEEITKIKLTPSGKALIKLEEKANLLSPKEQKILQACQQNSIAPSQTKVTPSVTRNKLIQKLINQGFLAVNSTRIQEVWLTGKGQKFLAEEYQPSGGGNFTLSKQTFKNYLNFIRQYYASNLVIEESKEKPTDEKIFQTIIQLYQELGIENYLPIFYLREKFQSILSREELDQSLYRLQKEDKLEMSSLVEEIDYTTEQIRAGIPQEIGGRLFFLIVNNL